MNTCLRSRRRSLHFLNLDSRVSLLETRVLPAGNVRVTLDALGGNLELTGDNASNSVQLLYDGTHVVVRGLDGTRIEGGTADWVVAGGSDTLNSVAVNLQRGHDFFYVSGGVNVLESLYVQPGSGNDTTVIRDATVAESLVVGVPLGLANDPGNDRVAIADSTAVNVFVSLGDGNDLAEIVDTVAGESIMALMGAGNDLLGGNLEATEDVIVGMGSGNDVMIGSITAGGLSIDMESGNDFLQLFEVEQNDPTRLASINLGKGNDKATVGAGMMGGVNFDSFLAVTGSTGNDRFYLQPGATISNGMVILDVESTAPYLGYVDPATRRQYSGTFRRVEEFGDFVASLP